MIAKAIKTVNSFQIIFPENEVSIQLYYVVSNYEFQPL